MIFLFYQSVIYTKSRFTFIRTALVQVKVIKESTNITLSVVFKPIFTEFFLKNIDQGHYFP